MRRADGLLALDQRHRVFDERFKRHRVVRDTVDERRIRPVLQQPPHQVGQQRLVRAHRGVDAARALHTERATHDLLVQRLAHAVQALELVLPRPPVGRPGHLHDGGHAVRVVGGELRVHRIRRRQQLACTGQVAHVAVRLAGVDGVVALPIHLRALDLAVPIGALHQPHHQPVAAAARQVDQPVDHRRAALLVRLNDEADAVPAGQRRLVAQPLQQVQRQLQPLGLLGVDVQADAVPARALGQRQQARVQLGQHAAFLRTAVARVQRRQLDRDAGPVDHPAPAGRAANGVDGLLVGRQVARCVGGRQRRLAQHVVRIAEALGLARAGVAQGFVDGLAGHELLAHQAHRAVHAGADQRLAALADEARE